MITMQISDLEVMVGIWINELWMHANFFNLNRTLRPFRDLKESLVLPSRSREFCMASLSGSVHISRVWKEMDHHWNWTLGRIQSMVEPIEYYTEWIWYTLKMRFCLMFPQDDSLETDSFHVRYTSNGWERGRHRWFHTSSEKSDLEASHVSHIFMEYKRHGKFQGETLKNFFWRKTLSCYLIKGLSHAN